MRSAGMVNGRRYDDAFEADYMDERATLRARNTTVTAEPDLEVSE